MPSFRVESLTVCDFVTQDQGGKSILVGVYSGEIRFLEPPSAWPPIFVSLVIDPLENKNFEFRLEFGKAKEGAVVRVTCEYISATEPPRDNRFVMNAQLPSVQFAGEGVYEFVVRDTRQKGKALFKYSIPVKIGQLEQLHVDVNARFEVKRLRRPSTTPPAASSPSTRDSPDV